MNKKYITKLSIVNIITFTRLIGAIALPICYYFAGSSKVALCALIIFTTDFIDGKLARHWKVQTFFGSLLDTICDKMFGISVIAMIAYNYHIMWIPLLFEIAIFLVNIYAYRGNKNVQSSKIGKWKTLVLDFAVIIALIVLTLPLIESKLSINFVNFINTYEATLINTIAGVIIGSQILALSDYSKKAFTSEYIKQFKGKKYVSFKEFCKMFFSYDFYMEHKNDPLRQFLYKK